MERLTAACEEQKLAQTKLQEERDTFKTENDKLRTENRNLQTENKEITEMVDRVKRWVINVILINFVVLLKVLVLFSEFIKLDAEQKFVRNMISNSTSDFIKQNETLKQQIEMLESEKQSLIEEKIKFFSGNNSRGEKQGRCLENTSPLLDIIEKLKTELEAERNEKAEIQDALKTSVLFQEKLLKKFDSELSVI